MKTLVSSFLLTITVIGCATYSQMMINAQGQMYKCGAYGHGLGGMTQANQINEDCISTMKAAGYIELERAGVVGFYYSEPLATDTALSILKVSPNSPAAFAGIRAGDILVSIDNQKVRKITDARILMFGLAGTPVTLVVMRGSEVIKFNLIRAPYTSVYGTY